MAIAAFGLVLAIPHPVRSQELALIGKMGSVTSEEIRTEKRRLEEAKDRFEVARQRVVVLSSQYEELEKERQENVASQEKLEAEVGQAREKLALVQAEMSKLSKDLEVATSQLAVSYADFSKRLAALYEMRSLPLFGFVLRSQSFSEFMRRYQYVRILTSVDIRKMEELSTLTGQIEQKRKALAAEQKRMESLKEEKRQKNQTLAKAIGKGQDILDKLRLERVSALSRATSLEKATCELTEKIKELEAERVQDLARKDGVGGQAKIEENGLPAKNLSPGKLGWPLDGDMEVVRPFGTVKHGNQPEYFNPGIDVRVVGLRTVKAVEAGRVIHHGTLPSFGKVLMIDHGGRSNKIISVYGNLDSIMVGVGQWVRRGDPVALVGQGTGQGGAEAQLHLEIRKNAEPLDPLVWLER